MTTELTAPMPKPARKPRKARSFPGVSAKMLKALQAIENGEARTQRAAATISGVHEASLSRFLATEKGRLTLNTLRQKNLRFGALRASRRMVELADADSEHISFRSSERLLEASGDLPTGSGGVRVAINNNMVGGMIVAPGYAINLNPEDIAADASPALPASEIDGSSAAEWSSASAPSNHRVIEGFAADGATHSTPLPTSKVPE